MNSKMVLIGGVALLLVGALAGYLYGVNSTPTKRTMSASPPPDAHDQVASTYANQLILLDAKNVSALVSEFESNATVEWRGYANGLQAGHGPAVNRDLRGTYTGSQEIGTLLGAFLTNANYFLVSNETQTIGAKGNYWVVNSTFGFTGNSSTVGTFEGTIAAQESYVQVGKMWLISNEMWDFTYYEAAFLG